MKQPEGTCVFCGGKSFLLIDNQIKSRPDINLCKEHTPQVKEIMFGGRKLKFEAILHMEPEVN